MGHVAVRLRSGYSWLWAYVVAGAAWATVAARVHGQTGEGQVLLNVLLWPVGLAQWLLEAGSRLLAGG